MDAITEMKIIKEEFERRISMINKIKAVCPDSFRKVYVRDNWYPSYKEGGTNKLYVKCEVICSYNTKFHTMIVFSGADDFSMAKLFESSDMSDVVAMYKKFRKYAANVPQNYDLKTILYRDGFETD